MPVSLDPVDDSITLSRKIGLVAAWASAFFGLLYLLGIVLNLTTSGSFYPSGQDVRTVSAVIAILWNLVLLLLFATLRREAKSSRSILAEIALAFAILVCATSVLAWFAGLTTYHRLAHAVGDDLATLMDPYNPASLAYALEHLGWGLFFGCAAVSAGLALDHRQASPLLPWLLITTGFLSLCHFLGVLASIDALVLLGFVSWSVTLPLSNVLLAMMFRRRLESERD